MPRHSVFLEFKRKVFVCFSWNLVFLDFIAICGLGCKRDGNFHFLGIREKGFCGFFLYFSSWEDFHFVEVSWLAIGMISWGFYLFIYLWLVDTGEIWNCHSIAFSQQLERRVSWGFLVLKFMGGFSFCWSFLAGNWSSFLGFVWISGL